MADTPLDHELDAKIYLDLAFNNVYIFVHVEKSQILGLLAD